MTHELIILEHPITPGDVERARVELEDMAERLHRR